MIRDQQTKGRMDDIHMGVVVVSADNDQINLQSQGS
jgi:hypothetical protein